MKQEKEQHTKNLKDYIEEITTPIFEEVLQEDLSNSMTTTKKTSSILFKPNNYRLKINVKEKTNSTLQEIKGTMGKLPMELNINSHTKLISIKKFKPNITIQYGRTTLTAIYSQEGIYHIERNTIDEVNHRITEIKEDIEKRLISALNQFSRKFNLSLPFKKPIWSRYEDWIKGEDYIDNLPRDFIIHDTYFKKVYGEGIEFKKPDVVPGILVKNYIKTRAIEDIAPEIANSINGMGHSIDKLTNTLTPTIADLNVNMKAHLSAIKGIDRSFKRFNNLLSQKDLRKWL